MRGLARTFAALADPTRLEMLALLLANEELCVCDLVEALEISQSKASRHLRYLWNAGLLRDRQAGQWVHYRLSDEPDSDGEVVVAALRKLVDHRDLSDVEGRLRRWLEGKGRLGGRQKRQVGCKHHLEAGDAPSKGPTVVQIGLRRASRCWARGPATPRPVPPVRSRRCRPPSSSDRESAPPHPKRQRLPHVSRSTWRGAKKFLAYTRLGAYKNLHA
jgi:ArsR family transcriptional regulator